MIPQAYANTEGESAVPFAGVCERRRQQIIVHKSLLAPLGGRAVKALTLRRDAAYKAPLLPSRMHLLVELSFTDRDPLSPDTLFEQNRGGSPAVRVFDAEVAIPASPAQAAGPVAWTADNTLRIPFEEPFSFDAVPTRHLCIHLEGDNVAGVGPCFWPVDAAYDGVPPKVSKVGESCGPWAGVSGFSSDVNRQTLRIGGTATLVSWAQPNTIGLPMISTAVRREPLLLGPGAPGCEIYLRDPVFLSPKVYSWAQDLLQGAGMARKQMPIPNDLGLLGLTFYVQWLNIEAVGQESNPLGVTTTNAVRSTLSPSVPSLRMAMVTSHIPYQTTVLPDTGIVETGRAPILRFDY